MSKQPKQDETVRRTFSSETSVSSGGDTGQKTDGVDDRYDGFYAQEAQSGAGGPGGIFSL